MIYQSPRTHFRTRPIDLSIVRRLRWFPLVWVLLLVGLSGSIALSSADTKKRAETPLELPELLETIRDRIGVEHLSAQTSWSLTGTARRYGTTHPFSERIESQGRYQLINGGELSEAEYVSREGAWVQNWSKLNVQLEARNEWSHQVQSWVRTHAWLQPDSPLQLELFSTGPRSNRPWEQPPSPLSTSRHSDKIYTVSFKGDDPAEIAYLRIDGATFFPLEYQIWSSNGWSRTRLSDWRLHDDVFWPFKIASRSGSFESTYTIESMTSDTASKLSASGPNWKTPDDLVFDKANPDPLPLDRTNGMLLVKAQLNGIPGWWIFDTGAAATVVDVQVAKKAALKRLAKIPVTGVGGTLPGWVSRGARFRIGDAELKEPMLVELDLRFLSRALNKRVAGIVGYELLGRSPIDLDLKNNQLSFFPDRTKLESLDREWFPLQILHSHPTIIGSIDDKHEGAFVIDTGNPRGLNIYAPAVSAFNLLKDRNVVDTSTGGVGGVTSAKSGRLESFGYLDQRLERPVTIFSTATEGAFTSNSLLGNLGLELFEGGVMTFDYAAHRLGWREAAQTVSDAPKWAHSMLDDFSWTDNIGSLGHRWRISTDQRRGGESELSMQSNDGVVKVTGELRPRGVRPGLAAMLLFLDPERAPHDISSFDALNVRLRVLQGPIFLKLMTEESDPNNTHRVELEATEDWVELTLPFEEFVPLNLNDDGSFAPLALKRFTAISFGREGYRGGPFEFEIDRLELVSLPDAPAARTSE